MDGVAMIMQAMRVREAQGFHVRVTGRDMPPEGFDACPKDEAQRDRWLVYYRSRGYGAEVVES